MPQAHRGWSFVTTNTILLVIGAAIALFWANLDPVGYHRFVDLPLWFNDLIGVHVEHWRASFVPAHPSVDAGDAERVVTLHFLVNDMLMALFFAIAGKEVWEAMVMEDGSLRGTRAATPLIATLGGMLGPVAVYLGLASVMGSDVYDAVARGWAIPTATDIAFSYIVGRVVFGAGHPAVRFLLLLAIADDAGGLIILAVFYPFDGFAPQWLLLSAAAALAVYLLANRLPRRLDRDRPLGPASTWVRTRLSYWPYLLAGAISWYGFARSGLHPALGLLPIIPAVPHAERGLGMFVAAERQLTDLLNHIANKLKYPVEIVLFLFGLLNAGVEIGSISEPTWLVMAGLLVGKPAGILLFGLFAAHVLRFGLPAGMRSVDLLVVGFVAAIGFTVSLFVATVAFPAGPIQDAAKMGALFSFSAALVSVALGRATGVARRPG